MAQVLPSYIGLFRAFHPATDSRIVDPQMLGDRRQPIPITAVGQEDQLRLRLLSVKQDTEGGPVGLRLPTWNLTDHTIGLDATSSQGVHAYRETGTGMTIDLLTNHTVVIV